MPKTNTLLHADHELDQLASRFAHWRQPRSHPSERIPQELWDQAAALARVMPYSRVAQHVRVSPSDLKKHMATSPTTRPATSAPLTRFVEVPPPPSAPSAAPGMEIEVERPDGARLRLRCPTSTVPVPALVQAFVEGA
jgi:hypothetical protein